MMSNRTYDCPAYDCPACNGIGIVDTNSGEYHCPQCGGTGKIRVGKLISEISADLMSGKIQENERLKGYAGELLAALELIIAAFDDSRNKYDEDHGEAVREPIDVARLLIASIRSSSQK